MKRAYSYLRFSTPEQRKGDSARRQIAKSETWCKQHGYTLDKSLHLQDLGVSAFKGQNLVEGRLGAFIKAVEQGEVKQGSVLIVESLDRLTRQEVPKALRVFLQILELGIVVVTLTPEERFELKTLNEIQLIIAIVTLSRAHGESELKSERVGEAWASKRKRIAAGEKLTKRIPTWLSLSGDRHTFIVDPEKAATVKLIFRLAIEGYGIGQIVKKLTKEKVKPLGRVAHWNRSTVAKLLHYRGVFGEFTPRHGRGGTCEAKRPIAGDPIPNYYPVVVSEADFYRAQDAMKSRKVATGRNSKRICNLFTGLVKDGRTSFQMEYVDKGQATFPKLVSSAYQRGEAVEPNTIRYHVFEAGFLKALDEVKPADILKNHSASDAEDRLQTAKGRLKEIEKRIKSCKARLAGDGEFEALIDVLKELESKKKRLAGEVESLNSEVSQIRETPLSEAREIADLLKSAKGEELYNLRVRLKARIRSLVHHVTVFAHDLNSATMTVFFRSSAVAVFSIFGNETVRADLQNCYWSDESDEQVA